MRVEVKIGHCENLIRGERDDWSDAQHCGYPTIDLGIPSERLICQSCRARSRAFIDSVTDQWVEAVMGDVQWQELTAALLDDYEARLGRMLAHRAPLSKIYTLQRDVDRRSRLYDRVSGVV